MRTNRLAVLIAVLMLAASIGAILARPSTEGSDRMSGISLDAMVPKHFGDWSEEPQPIVQVVNPQARTLVDAIYSQLLERTYLNADGYRIMLSLAYSSDQRDFRAHYPEACYIAAGFILHRREISKLRTVFGDIPVGRLFTSRGAREEPLTYWVRLGDIAVLGWQSRLVELSYTLTGRIPDGLLFRVSSVDPDQSRANRMHDQFISQLLQAVSPDERKRLSGLGDV
jgi:EpsI family protein